MDRTGDDDDDVDAEAPLGHPLHPDDRLWRHPSELASAGLPSALQSGDVQRDRRAAGRWLPVVLAGTVGALLTAGLMTVTGGVERPGREQAATPPTATLVSAVSSPTAPPTLADLAERVEKSLVAVSGVGADGRMTRGSGLVIRPDRVLTAARLVVGTRQLDVLVRGAGRRATLVGADADTDLAVLAVDGGGLTPVEWGEGGLLRPGDPAVAISSPPASATGPTVTAGIVSAVGRTLAFAGTELRGLLQVDRPVPPEGAGGALLDPHGAVVGITLPTASLGAPFGYAVPAPVAKDVARQLLAGERVDYAWLGVEGADWGMNGGAEVQRVKPASPADRAGLQAGDVVTEVNGVRTPSMGTLLGELRQHRPGETLRLLVLRAAQTLEILVTLSDRP